MTYLSYILCLSSFARDCSSFTLRKQKVGFRETFSVIKVVLLALIGPSTLSLELDFKVLPPLFIVDVDLKSHTQVC